MDEISREYTKKCEDFKELLKRNADLEHMLNDEKAYQSQSIRALEEYRNKLSNREKFEQQKESEWSKAYKEFSKEMQGFKKEIEILKSENAKLRDRVKEKSISGASIVSKEYLEGIQEKEDEIRMLWKILDEHVKDAKQLSELKNKVDLKVLENRAKRSKYIDEA